MKIGKSTIEHLRCPPGRADALFFDDVLPGFGVRVTAAGSRSFIFQGQIGGRDGLRVRMTLGRYPAMMPDQARRQAEIARGDLLAGRDPSAARKATAAAARAARAAKAAALTQPAEISLGSLIDLWQRAALADRSAAHRREGPRALRRAFAQHLAAAARDLPRAEVQAVLDGIAPRAPAMARRVRNYGAAMFNWARRRDLTPADVNPFAAAVVDGRPVARDRVLSDAELAEAWCAAPALGLFQGAFVRLLILTLQRRGEVAGMAWSELAPDLTSWTIPAARAKNRVAHVVHLAEPARAILRGLPRMLNSPLVFPASRRRTDATKAGAPAPISGFSQIAAALFAAIRAERERRGVVNPPPLDWRLHDLRRTGVTAMARLGVQHAVADRVLNHVHGRGAISGVAAVYQRFEFLAEREVAMDLWAEHVLTIAGAAGESGAGQVVPLRRR